MEDIFEKLKKTAEKAQEEEEFPNYLMRFVMMIYDEHEKYSDKLDMIAYLQELIADYNTYAEACCEKIGASPMDVETQLIKITGKRP